MRLAKALLEQKKKTKKKTYYLISFSLIFPFVWRKLLGDEILAINGTGLEGLRHAQAIGFFKAIKSGNVALQVCRRLRRNQM